MQYCPSCNKKMPDCAHFCGHCGYQLNYAPIKIRKIPLSSIQRQSIDVPAPLTSITLSNKVLNTLPGPIQHSIAALLIRVRDPEPEVFSASHSHSYSHDQNTEEAGIQWGWLPMLALISTLGVFSVAYAYTSARDASNGASNAELFFWLGLLLIFVPAVIRLIAPHAVRFERVGLLCVVGISFYLVNMMYNPLYFSSFDEFLHWSTVNAIVSSGHLFSNNPLLPISPFYPGLEIVTDGFAKLSGLSTFIAGIVVVGVARLVMVLALFSLYELMTKSARIASIAIILYMANPHFLYFDAQFAYESFALPLAILVLFVIAHHETLNSSRHWLIRMTLIACIILAAVAVTHHVTDFVFDGFLLLWAVIFVFQRPARTYWSKGRLQRSPLLWTTLFGLLVSIAWISLPGSPVVDYLFSPFVTIFNELGKMVSGTGGGRQLFVAYSGQPTPPWQRLLMLASVALISLSLPFGLLCLWFRYRSNALVWMLGIVALVYPVSLVLRLTDSGSEISDRSSAFLFISVACVLAIFIAQFWPTQRLNWKHTSLLVSVISVVFLGGIILGNGSASEILPGPYMVAADGRSIEPEGIQSAEWAYSYLGPNNRMATDRVNQLLMSTFGNQRLVTPTEDKIDEEAIFFSPSLGSYEISVLQQARVRYLVVDLRLSTALPYVGFYYDEGEPDAYQHTTPIAQKDLTKFNTVPQINRMFDSGNIVMYDVGGLSNAPQQP